MDEQEARERIAADPVLRAYVEMTERKRANRVRNWVNPLAALQEATAGNSAQQPETETAIDPT